VHFITLLPQDSQWEAVTKSCCHAVLQLQLELITKWIEYSKVVGVYSTTMLVWIPGRISIMGHTYIRSNEKYLFQRTLVKLFYSSQQDKRGLKHYRNLSRWVLNRIFHDISEPVHFIISNEATTYIQISHSWIPLDMLIKWMG